MFDVESLCQLVSQHASIVRVVVASAAGSVPRGVGTSMCVWADGQIGTIGGGMLEFQATEFARDLGARKGDWIRRVHKMPLGPALGQCCGGSVTLLAEVYTQKEANEVRRISVANSALSRPVESGLSPCGKNAEKQGLTAGLMTETFAKSGPPLWIHGAGHVGRALVHTLLPLGFDITWVETESARYPETLPKGVNPLVSADPARSVRYAPATAHHLIVTCSHALDLEICHALLEHGFLSAGLIGSATKWAKFQKRLVNLGHSPANIAKITCPIGMPELGKSPQAIAVGVAADLLRATTSGYTQVSDLKEYAS